MSSQKPNDGVFVRELKRYTRVAPMDRIIVSRLSEISARSKPIIASIKRRTQKTVDACKKLDALLKAILQESEMIAPALVNNMCDSSCVAGALFRDETSSIYKGLALYIAPTSDKAILVVCAPDALSIRDEPKSGHFQIVPAHLGYVQSVGDRTIWGVSTMPPPFIRRELSRLNEKEYLIRCLARACTGK